MVDVGEKAVTDRRALAEALVRMAPRAPAAGAACAELLVEAPDPLEQRPTQEEARRGDEIPHVPCGQEGRVGTPAGIAPSARAPGSGAGRSTTTRGSSASARPTTPSSTAAGAP